MSFDQFVQALSAAGIEFEHLKVAQLAQAILESGRGSSDLFKQYNNPYGMKYRPEMAGTATSVTYTDSAGETDRYCHFPDYQAAVAGYWKFIGRAPYEGWRLAAATAAEYIRFITFAGYLGGPHASVSPSERASDKAKKDAYVSKVWSLFSEAERRLRDVHKNLPAPALGQIWKRKGVFIDVGHGDKPEGFDPGAVHKGSKITEHALNLIAARACAKAIADAGVPVLVDDGNKSNHAAGKASAGYDVFVSVHHNSSENRAQGSEAFYHVTAGTQADKALASSAASAMARSLGIRDRGPKGGSLSVLSGARAAAVRAAVLAEMYFIHDQTPPDPDPATFAEWSDRSGAALGGAVVEWLKSRG